MTDDNLIAENEIERKKWKIEALTNRYNQLDETNQKIFVERMEEDIEVLSAFVKTIAVV